MKVSFGIVILCLQMIMHSWREWKINLLAFPGEDCAKLILVDTLGHSAHYSAPNHGLTVSIIHVSFAVTIENNAKKKKKKCFSNDKSSHYLLIIYNARKGFSSDRTTYSFKILLSMAHLNEDLLLKMSHSFLIVFHIPNYTLLSHLLSTIPLLFPYTSLQSPIFTWTLT